LTQTLPPIPTAGPQELFWSSYLFSSFPKNVVGQSIDMTQNLLKV
jgi:hypothetical protein